MAFLTAMALGAVIDISTGVSMGTLNKLSGAFDVVRSKIAGVQTALGRSFTGFQQLALMSAGASLGMSYMAKRAADFEMAMARVSAKLDDKSMLGALREQAKELAMTTQYSAEQVAGGQELMAQAGFNANEVMAAMPGILAAAAAEQLDLSTATDILTSTLRGFGFQTTETSRVADVFAQASASTNATIIDMGESMKYVAPLAKTLNMDFEEVTASIGLLANVGIKGSQAGTSLRMALVHLTAPTLRARKALASMGLSAKSLQDKDGNLLQLNQLLLVLNKGMEKLGGNADKMGALAHITGVEAAPAMLALMDAAKRGDLERLTGDLKGATGAAQEMADILDDTVIGHLNRLWHTLEVIGIQFMETFGSTPKDMLKSINDSLHDFYWGMKGAPLWTFWGHVGRGAQMAFDAINTGINAIKPGMNWLSATVEGGMGFGSAEVLGYFMVVAGLLTVGLVPLVGGLTILFNVLGSIASIVSPLVGWVGVLLVGAFLAFGAAIGLTFASAEAQGIGFFEGIVYIIDGLRQIMQSAQVELTRWWGPIGDMLSGAMYNISAAWTEVVMAMGGATFRSQSDMSEFGLVVGKVAGAMLWAAAAGLYLTAIFIRIGAVIFRAVTGSMSEAQSRIISGFFDLLTGAKSFREGLVQIFAGMELMLTSPIRMAMSTVYGLMAGVLDNPVGRKIMGMSGLDAEMWVNALREAQEGMADANATEYFFGEAAKTDHSKAMKGALDDHKRKAAAATAADQAVAANGGNLVLTSQTDINLDGRQIASVVKKQEQELSERAGFSQTPWQKRTALERSSTSPWVG